MPDLKKTLAYLYVEETKFTRETIYERKHPTILPEEPFKRYPESEKVLLPRHSPKVQGPSLWEVLQSRRSERHYSRGPVGLDELAILLWSGQGVTAQAGTYYLRTSPSAGALYPIETYVVGERVVGLDPGLYHFDVRGFQLERLRQGSLIGEVTTMALGQGFLRSASVVLVFSAVLRRTMSKYGNRGLRYIFLDAGHIAQNVLLAAEALGLGACPVAAFFDDEFNEAIGLDGQEETVIYLVAIGRKKGSEREIR